MLSCSVYVRLQSMSKGIGNGGSWFFINSVSVIMFNVQILWNVGADGIRLVLIARGLFI